MAPFSKGDIINFNTRANGIFEVVEPVMSEEEIFDSSLLESTIVGLINEGKRNFALDLSPLDYIYSDAMNKLLSINRQVLDVSGRLSLLAPRPEVRQILERAGIHNFLKVFNTEEDLVRSMRDIIKQTQSISLDAIRAMQAGAVPRSEFEDFRSEIDRAFSEPSEDIPRAAPARAPAPQPPSFGPPPAPPRRPEPFVPQAPAAYPPPPSRGPSYAPVSPGAPSFGPPPQPQQVPSFGPPQAFGPPPQRPPAPDFGMTRAPQMAPPPPPMQAFGAPAMPQVREPEPIADFSPPMPAVERPLPPREEGPPPKPSRPAEEERFPRREMFEEEKKKFPMGALVVVLLIIAIGAAAFFAFNKGLIKLPGRATSVTAVEQATPPSIPQLDIEEQKLAGQEEEAVEEEMVKGPAPSRPTPRPTPRRATPAPARTTTASRPAPQPAPAPAPSGTARTDVSATNQLFVTSLPPGATVKIDGAIQGTTPYAWPNPSVYGTVTLEVEKLGYQNQKRAMEYTGGVAKEHFVLEREAPAPSVVSTTPPPRAEPVPAPEPEPVREPAPAPAVSAPPPAPVAAAPSPAARPPEPKGEEGSIFIASIPPVADVYMDGVRIGKTNVEELKVRSGTHDMKFVKGGKEISKQMTFKPGKNASQMIRIP